MNEYTAEQVRADVARMRIDSNDLSTQDYDDLVWGLGDYALAYAALLEAQAQPNARSTERLHLSCCAEAQRLADEVERLRESLLAKEE